MGNICGDYTYNFIRGYMRTKFSHILVARHYSICSQLSQALSQTIQKIIIFHQTLPPDNRKVSEPDKFVSNDFSSISYQYHIFHLQNHNSQIEYCGVNMTPCVQRVKKTPIFIEKKLQLLQLFENQLAMMQYICILLYLLSILANFLLQSHFCNI